MNPSRNRTQCCSLENEKTFAKDWIFLSLVQESVRFMEPSHVPTRASKSYTSLETLRKYEGGEGKEKY